MEECYFRLRSRRWGWYALAVLCVVGAAVLWNAEDMMSRMLDPLDTGLPTRPAARPSSAAVPAHPVAAYLHEYDSLIMVVVNVAVALWLVVVPTAALWRARRRAGRWQADRSAAPLRRTGWLTLMFLFALYGILHGLAAGGSPLLGHGLGETAEQAIRLEGEIFLVLGLAIAAVVAAGLVRRRHFRNWRLRLAEVPVHPSTPVALELFREDGRPLGGGVRLDLVGYLPRSDRRGGCRRLGFRLRRVAGQVQMEPADGGNAALRGVLWLEGAVLSAVPPVNEPAPRRLFACLRVRQGWGMSCVFELPVPELYPTPGAGVH
jgi:hypothetical protein